MMSFLLESLALFDAETMLLVDDNKTQIVVLHAFRNQRVSTDDEVHLALCDAFKHAPSLLRFQGACQ